MPTADGQLTAAELAQIYALVQAQAVIRQQLMDLATTGAAAAFRALRNWYDTAEVILAALQALRIVQPAQRRMAEVTDAYLARVLTTMTGRPYRPLGAVDVTRLRRELTDELLDALDDFPDVEVIPDGDLDVDRLFRDPGKGIEPRPARPADDDLPVIRARTQLRQTYRPADMVEVYSRAAAEYRYRVSTGADHEVAKAAGLERARQIAETDISLAAQQQEYVVMSRVPESDAVGWRRVLRPELSKGGSCGLCIVAADRIYRRGDLKAIHLRCNCIVVPVGSAADPGFQLNSEDLARIYKAAGNTGGDVIKGGKRFSAGLKYVRAQITEDGELGPILVEAPESTRTNKPRRSARDAVKASRTGRVLSPEERLPGLIRSADETRRRYEAGEVRLAPAVDYYDRLIDELRAQLAGV